MSLPDRGLGIQGDAYFFKLVVGEMYAIQHDPGPQHGGTYIGTVAVGEQIWLAFETAHGAVKFYNPAQIKTLLAESDPRRLA